LLLCITLIIAFTFSGCGEPKLKGALNGKWYYIYDLENVGLNIKDNGTAVLDSKKYDCTYDSDRIHLFGSNGTQDLRYTLEGENQMYLYKIASYKYQGEGTPNGLIGMWIDTDNGHSSFEFTTEGTFREDSYIPGYYTVNESEGTIFFVYNYQYYDTTIYYTLKDDILVVEYPWAMVKLDN